MRVKRTPLEQWMIRRSRQYSRLASSRGRTGGLAPFGLVRVPAARQMADEIKISTVDFELRILVKA